MAEIMIKAACFVFVIIIAFILKQVHVLEKRDGLTIATIIMNVTLPCALLTNASGVTIDQSILILLLEILKNWKTELRLTMVGLAFMFVLKMFLIFQIFILV